MIGDDDILTFTDGTKVRWRDLIPGDARLARLASVEYVRPLPPAPPFVRPRFPPRRQRPLTQSQRECLGGQ